MPRFDEEQLLGQLKGKPFAGVLCPIMDPKTVEVCARVAGELGNGPKNKFVATSLAHAMPYQGPLLDGVRIGYCMSIFRRRSPLR